MIAHAFAALAGNLCMLLWPGVAPPYVAATAIVALLLSLACGRPRWTLFFLAFVWTACHIHDQRTRTLRADERVLAEVTIATLPAYAGTARQFDGIARLVRQPGAPVLRVRVTWRPPLPQALRAGETWQLALQLREVQDITNPGAVDGLRVLWRDHVHARAEVLRSPLNQRLLPGRSPLLRMRENIARHLLDSIPDPAAAALLAALAVGYTAEVGRNEWQIYNATGITHLIAISGMHVTLFAAVVMMGLRRVWGWWPWLAWRVRRETFVAVAGALCALGYALLAGYSVPTQRTVLMLMAGLAWRARARASTPASALGASTLAVLATDPFATLAAGFWLSFGAVAAILWREAVRLRAPTGVRGALRLQLAITVLLAPATLANFSSVSLVGLLVNPLAIPLFSFVLVPLVLIVAALQLAGVPASFGALPLWLAGITATPSVAWLALAAHAPLALLQADPPGWWYLCACGACVTLIFPMALRLRLLAVAAALPLLCVPARPQPGGFLALSLDAGGAPLVLVVTRDHALLYGTGDRFGTAGGRIANLVVPAARYLGVRQFDLLIAGRLDRDVSGGVGTLQALLPARRISAGVPKSGELPPGITACETVDDWEWDAVRFELRPAAGTGGGCELSISTDTASLHLDPRPQAAPVMRGAVRIEARAGKPLRRERVPAGPGAWHAKVSAAPHRPPGAG